MPRLFFALWPDGPAREVLACHATRVARLARGRPVPAAKLHLTLVFLGAVDRERLGAVRRAADAVQGARFAMTVDCVGGFRGAGVGWAGCRVPPACLLALQSSLQSALAAERFAPEARPYAPHLTLARRISLPVADEAIAPVSWEARAFALVASSPAGGGYATLAEWPLGERKS
jgi:2'-5' RNA ligase